MDSSEQIQTLQAELKQLKKENKTLKRELYESEKVMIGVQQNYTFQKSIYDSLKKEKEKQDIYLRLVFKYTPDIVFVVDTEYKLINVTKNSLAKFGVSLDFDPGKPSEKTAFELFEPFVPLDQLRYAFDITNMVVQSGKAFRQKEIELTINGKNYVFEGSVVPLKNSDGEIIGSMMNLHDVTDLHNALKASERAGKAKSNFLAKVSHEIRTPMNAVCGLSELVLREELTKEVRSHVHGIKDAGEHLVSLINDILDFSKIESGMMEIVPCHYTLQSLLNYAIGITRTKLVELPILFTADVSPKIPNRLVGDEMRIRQMLLNLLSNAGKYNVKGFIKLRVRHEVTDSETIMLYLEVADSGIGIKKKNLSRLFGDFVQLGETVGTKEVEGTGLGLAITRGFAEAMGGTITVRSEFGVGSVFTIAIPQKLEQPTVQEVFAEIKPEYKNTTVLIYETREVFAYSLITSLKALGIEYTLSANQSDFLRQLELRGKDFDFVFVSSFSYDSTEKLIRSMTRESVPTVLIAEYGELAVENEQVKTLFMPAHTADLAMLFNGMLEDDQNSPKRTGANFIAPKAKALIVDDINTNLIVAQGLLCSYQMEIDLCKSGRESIDMVQAKEYDIVFMDHMMPEMDGIEAVSHIRGLSKSPNDYFRKLPIVALTANAVSGVKEMFLKNGFSDFLAKPIAVNLLDNILEKWLPANKLEDRIDAATGDESDSGAALKSLQVKGIDVEAGIYMTGGDANNYLKTLTIFRDDGLEKINIIRDCAEKEDLPLYAIHIHALKSASASIGASKISNFAKTLETAAKNTDNDFVIKNNEKFIEELEMLLESINEAIISVRSAKKKGGGKRESVKVDTALVEERAGKLKDALTSFDMEEVDALLTLLREQAQPESELENAIEEISNNILICEYDSAEELTDKLVEIARGGS